MTQEIWTAVDTYINSSLALSDPPLEAALKENARAGLPLIDVTPSQGALLYLFARMQGAHRILEIGTLGGYSTIWLARSLPQGGKLVTLEVDPKHAQVAKANVARAGFGEIVDLRLGPAIESLAQLATEGAGPFDLFFIDADKRNNPAYLEWSLRLSRPGSIILVDNVVRDGKLVEKNNRDPDIVGNQRMIEMLANEPRVESTIIQTVGTKGYDGFALVRVKSSS